MELYPVGEHTLGSTTIWFEQYETRYPSYVIDSDWIDVQVLPRAPERGENHDSGVTIVAVEAMDILHEMSTEIFTEMRIQDGTRIPSHVEFEIDTAMQPFIDVGYWTSGKNATYMRMIYSPFKPEMYEALYGKTTVTRIIFYDRPKLLKAEIIFRFTWSQIAPKFMSPLT